MTDERPEKTSQTTETDTDSVVRRKFLAASCGAGAMMLAGCSSESGSDDGSSDGTGDDPDSEADPDGSSGEANFRLLISDRPADIGDFDRLDVTFDRARIFEGGSEDESTEGDGDDGTDGDQETDGNQTADGDEPTDNVSSQQPADDQSDDEDGNQEDDDSGAESDDEAVERQRGFYTLDLDGATVDLTQVVDDRAISVFDGQLSAGSYNKIELYVADIEGVVGGEIAEVKVPSGKLQITHPFEITAGETVDFVFDINVVKRGQELRYNLTPVISESGVGGKDVEVEEVGDEDSTAGSEEDESGDDEDESSEEADKSTEEDTDGNETKGTDTGSSDQ